MTVRLLLASAIALVALASTLVSLSTVTAYGLIGDDEHFVLNSQEQPIPRGCEILRTSSHPGVLIHYRLFLDHVKPRLILITGHYCALNPWR
jgi:hypothetical protein